MMRAVGKMDLYSLTSIPPKYPAPTTSRSLDEDIEAEHGLVPKR
jgi:hypothetical protein